MLSFLLAITVLILAPGANMLMILTIASTAGASAARRAALGLTVGVCCHTLLAATGVSLLVHQWPSALRGIQWVGGAVLIWIGGSMVYHQLRSSLSTVAPGTSAHSAFIQGVSSSLSNVKTIVLFVSFLPQFFDPHAAVATQFFRYGGAYAPATPAIYTTIGSLAGQFAHLLQRPAIRHWLRIVAGLVICGFGISGIGIW